MVNIDIGIVILHYNNIKDTIECVQSFIKNLDTHNYHILVFDNASPNQSGKALVEMFKHNAKVEVYLNDKNIGFGAGNNKGISLIRQKYSPKFIVLSNNDIVLTENHLFRKTSDEFSFSRFAVLGPKIKTADGREDSNPIFDYPYTKEACKWNLKTKKRKLLAYKLHIYPLYNKFRSLAYKAFPCLEKKRPPTRKNGDPERTLVRREGVVCHGSFLILSALFFSHYNGFVVRSFMYAEEDILYMQLKCKGLKSVYNPNIQVYHKENASVDFNFSLQRDKAIFLLKRHIEAEEGYLSFLDDICKNKHSF